MPKKATTTSIKDDDILADILGELQDKPKEGSATNGTRDGGDKPHKVIAPARIVSNSSKKSDAALAKEYMNSFMNNLKSKETSSKSKDTSDDELLDSILKSKPNEKSKMITPKPIEKKRISTDLTITQESLNTEKPSTSKNKAEGPASSSTSSNKPVIPDDDMDFSCFQDDENQFELEKTLSSASASSSSKKIESPVKPSPKPSIEPTKKSPPVANQEEDIQKLLSNWENICQMDNFEEELTATNSTSSNGTSESTENLRFWYWEAWEDALRRPGEVFLFGRTAEGKSICVRVEKIDRVVYLLPREYVSRFFIIFTSKFLKCDLNKIVQKGIPTAPPKYNCSIKTKNFS